MKVSLRSLKLICGSILFSIAGYSQANLEEEVFDAIILHEIPFDMIFIACEKSKTFFEVDNFKKKSSLNVPDDILNELQESASKSQAGFWGSQLINKIENILINSEKCLTKENREELFRDRPFERLVLFISQPIFDESRENCVVHIVIQMQANSFGGHSYFLKKVYGKWVVIEMYDGWIS